MSAPYLFSDPFIWVQAACVAGGRHAHCHSAVSGTHVAEKLHLHEGTCTWQFVQEFENTQRN